MFQTALVIKAVLAEESFGPGATEFIPQAVKRFVYVNINNNLVIYFASGEGNLS